MYSRLLVIRWRSPSRSQQQIKAIYPSTLQMQCAVLISVVSSSVADGWAESDWRFWSNPWTVPNAPTVTSTIFVLTFHILLASFSRSLHLFSCSVSFVFTFESIGVAISISRQVFSFLSYSTVSGRFVSTVRSVTPGTSHIQVVPLTFMALSGIWWQYLSGTCNRICLHVGQWM